MTTFRVLLTREAQEDVRRLAPEIRARILDKLAWMGQNADLLRHQALQGDAWSSCFKYRVGDYRIIYQLDPAGPTLTVLKIGHRREVYR
jgi:mRNA interferase RelE/StbE